MMRIDRLYLLILITCCQVYASQGPLQPELGVFSEFPETQRAEWIQKMTEGWSYGEIANWARTSSLFYSLFQPQLSLLRYWTTGNIQFKELVHHRDGQRGDVFCLAFSPQRHANLLASGSWDGTIKLWNIQTCQTINTLFHGSQVESVAFSPDGALLASGALKATSKLWNVQTGQEIEKFELPSGGCYPNYAVAFSPDGSLLASVCSYHDAIILRNAVSGKENALEGHKAPVESIAFSPDGTLLASGSMDGTIRLWEMWRYKTINGLERKKSNNVWVRSVAFSPDGTLLAAGYFDGIIKLWNVQSGQEIMTLGGHAEDVKSVAFSPDGKLLASGSADQTVILWNVQTGQEIKKLEGHGWIVSSVVFSPNGQLLASGSWDGTIRLWYAVH